MKINLKSSRRIVSLLLLSLVLAGCASSPSAPSPELMQRIESARISRHRPLAGLFRCGQTLTEEVDTRQLLSALDPTSRPA